MKPSELRASILKLLEEKQCLTETQLFKEMDVTDNVINRVRVSTASVQLVRVGKLVWKSGDQVGTISFPRSFQ